MTTTHPFSELDAMAFFDGEMAADRAAEFEVHLRTCAVCQAIGESVTGVRQGLSAWQTGEPPATLVAPARRGRMPLSPVAKFALAAAAMIALITGAVLFAPPAQCCPSIPEQTVPVQLGPMQSNTGPEAANFENVWLAQPRETLLTRQQGTARVLIVAFIDWLCDTCHFWQQRYASVLDQYERMRPGQVKMEFHDWPWSVRCNPALKSDVPNHRGTCFASMAVRIARDRGKAQAMIDWLRDNVEPLSKMSEQEAIDAIKQELRRLLGGGFDIDAAAAALQPALDADIALGQTLKINATPTYFINGVRISQPLSPEHLEQAIEIELRGR